MSNQQLKRGSDVVIKHSFDEFNNLLREKFPKEKIKIIRYNGSSKPGIIYYSLCKKQHYIYRMSILLKDTRKNYCPKCFLSKYNEKAIKECVKNKDIEFIKIGYCYKNRKPTIIYQCKYCKGINEKPSIEFLKYSNCIYCSKNGKRTNTKGFNTKLKLNNLPYKIVSNYNGARKKAVFRREYCQTIFETYPDDIITGHTGCPVCSKKNSKGEQRIIDYFNEKGIQFTKEKTFEWSKRKRYDFYVSDVKLLIEFQGIQLFKTVNDYWLPFEQQKEIDTFKRIAAIENGYNYLSINYFDFERIPNILAQRLSELEYPMVKSRRSKEHQKDEDIV